MDDPQEPTKEQMFLELIQEGFTTHCRLEALVQMLIDKKVLQGKEEGILKELSLRTDDIKWERLQDVKTNARAQFLRDACSKLPKQ